MRAVVPPAVGALGTSPGSGLALSVLLPLSRSLTRRRTTASAAARLDAVTKVLGPDDFSFEAVALPIALGTFESAGLRAAGQVRVLGPPAPVNAIEAVRAAWPSLRGALIAWMPKGAAPSFLPPALRAMEAGAGVVFDGTGAARKGAWCARRELVLEAFIRSGGSTLVDGRWLERVARTCGLAVLDAPTRMTKTIRLRRTEPLLRPPRPTAITADDWGLSPAVNDGIVELARAGVVRRVSMLARADKLDHRLDELLRNPVEVGLHFDLVREGQPLPVLLAKWGLATGDVRRSLQDEARNRLGEQLEELSRRGLRPTYLDGHQHVHLLPGFLDAVVDLLRAAGVRRIRVPLDGRSSSPRRALINALALLGRRSVRRLGLTTAPCIYPTEEDFRDYTRLRALVSEHPDHEVIVHPACGDVADLPQDDPYTVGRIAEYRALRLLACEREETAGAPPTIDRAPGAAC